MTRESYRGQLSPFPAAVRVPVPPAIRSDELPSRDSTRRFRSEKPVWRRLQRLEAPQRRCDATKTPLRSRFDSHRLRLSMRFGWPQSRMDSGDTRPASSSVVRRRRGLSGLSRRRPRVRVPSLPFLVWPAAMRFSGSAASASSVPPGPAAGPLSNPNRNFFCLLAPVHQPLTRPRTLLREARHRLHRERHPYAGGAPARGSLPDAASAWRGGQPALGVA
jgi:hypothetical protein